MLVFEALLVAPGEAPFTWQIPSTLLPDVTLDVFEGLDFYHDTDDSHLDLSSVYDGSEG